MNIYEKLSAVQAELKAPKSQYNKFGGYKYRKAEDILEAVKPLLAKNKATLTISDDLVLIGERYYIKATATITDTEKGDAISTTSFAREEESKKGMDGSQVTGASSSYARKYALNGLLSIDDTADSDTTNDGSGQAPAPARKASRPAPAPAPAPEQPKRAMSKENYWKMVAAQAEGKMTSEGQMPRDWWIDAYEPSQAEIDRFDLDLDNYKTANNL